jgi:hypothetical protein
MARKRRVKKSAAPKAGRTQRKSTGGAKTRIRTAASATTALQVALPHLRAAHQALISERAKLDGQIAALASLFGGEPAPAARTAGTTPRATRAAGGRTPYRSGSLKEHLHNALAQAGGAMAVKDLTTAVVANGYTSANKTLAKSVGIALAEMKDVQKVKRGLFRLK